MKRFPVVNSLGSSAGSPAGKHHRALLKPPMPPRRFVSIPGVSIVTSVRRFCPSAAREPEERRTAGSPSLQIGDAFEVQNPVGVEPGRHGETQKTTATDRRR